MLMGTTAIANSALAGEEVWSTKSGKTNFSMPMVTACSQGNKAPIKYDTIFNNIPYSGMLWVQRVQGCDSARRVVITGYFEQTNESRGEKCRGQIVLTLNNKPNFINGNGSVSWRSISSAPGFSCPYRGQRPQLELVQTGP